MVLTCLFRVVLTSISLLTTNAFVSLTLRSPQTYGVVPQSRPGNVDTNLSSPTRSNQLDDLIKQASLPADSTLVVPISGDAAFCNNVYRIQTGNQNLIAKIFSGLAKERMSPSFQLGELDEIAAAHSLGPAILAKTSGGILMEEIQGSLLTEASLHGPDPVDARMIGKALAQLHAAADSVKDTNAVDKNHNMLWRACLVMLSLTDESWEAQSWNKERLVEAMNGQRDEIERLDLPQVNFGHGDCKPSNLIMTSGGICFLDLELAGRHYRGYDLSKVFRTDNATSHTKANQRECYASYLQTAGSDDSIDQLELEAMHLHSMTWLEAALFFSCMSCQDPDRSSMWNDLAVTRLEGFSRVLETNCN